MTDLNAQFDFVEVSRCPAPVILGMYDSNGNYVPNEKPVTGVEIVFGRYVEKPCRQIERRLTHGFGYDENSSMRQGVQMRREDDDLFPSDSLVDYLNLKDELKRKGQNSALRNIWEHLRRKSI
ncbi:hypothetical protein HZC32_01495 [Candidatus Woesearchaeota archaeon]|nr:hypothetical protein [Candidatus Woesearchaeota archaeon]